LNRWMQVHSTRWVMRHRCQRHAGPVSNDSDGEVGLEDRYPRAGAVASQGYCFWEPIERSCVDIRKARLVVSRCQAGRALLVCSSIGTEKEIDILRSGLGVLLCVTCWESSSLGGVVLFWLPGWRGGYPFRSAEKVLRVFQKRVLR